MQVAHLLNCPMAACSQARQRLIFLLALLCNILLTHVLYVAGAETQYDFSSAASLGSISSPDIDALLQFKQHVIDLQHFLADWQRINGSSSSRVCRWRGVSCDESQRVSTLDLSQAHLSGNLPESALSNLLLQLDHLKILSLSDNNFSGNFAGRSHVMQSHAAGGNLQNCSLQILDLSVNNFSGEVPAIFDRCSSLESIDLSSNFFSGGIPSSLAALQGLRYLNLASNSLFGEIPAELAKTCGALQELDLSNNKRLFGSIPLSFSSCASIVSLQLSRNNFSGKFPDILGGMPRLQILKIDFNMFEGMIPSLTENNTQLQVFDVSSNLFSIFPQEVCGSNSSLTHLYLPNNQLTSSIPTSIASCTRLQLLDLSFNSLTGNLPPQILYQLQELEYLVIWYSGLSGLIPPEIERCLKLKTFILSYNSLQGPIPSQLFNCTNLTHISLSGNQLSGPIPPELGKLKNLIVFEVDSNSLVGPIPWEIENCSSLVYLDLSSNRLDGVIPPRIGTTTPQTVANLSIPNSDLKVAKKFGDHLCKGSGADIIDIHGLRNEQLSNLPMFNPTGCPYRLYPVADSNYNSQTDSLFFLDLSYNMLTGPVPPEFGSMNDLLTLDLSHNSLNGSIPFSLGQLLSLQVLYLSCNQLQGSIPPTLSRLTFLFELNLSQNHLSGRIPAGGQLGLFPASVYLGNDLCGIPLGECSPSFSSIAGQANPPNSYSSDIKDDELGLRSIILIFTAIFFLCTILVWEICARVYQHEALAVYFWCKEHLHDQIML